MGGRTQGRGAGVRAAPCPSPVGARRIAFEAGQRGTSQPHNPARIHSRAGGYPAWASASAYVVTSGMTLHRMWAAAARVTC
jgi:hypothetical protein